MTIEDNGDYDSKEQKNKELNKVIRTVIDMVESNGDTVINDLMEEKGIAAYVGKVNMDRNSIPGLLETKEESLEETKQWIADCEDKKK